MDFAKSLICSHTKTGCKTWKVCLALSASGHEASFARRMALALRPKLLRLCALFLVALYNCGNSKLARPYHTGDLNAVLFEIV